jgi:hypothetical protein
MWTHAVAHSPHLRLGAQADVGHRACNSPLLAAVDDQSADSGCRWEAGGAATWRRKNAF